MLELADAERECFQEVGSGDEGALTWRTRGRELDEPRLCRFARGLMRPLALRPLPTDDMEGDLAWCFAPLPLPLPTPLLMRRLMLVDGDPLSMWTERLERRECTDDERCDFALVMGTAWGERMLCVLLVDSRRLAFRARALRVGVLLLCEAERRTWNVESMLTFAGC